MSNEIFKTVFDDFRIGPQIASGGCGTVYEATSSGGEIFALKVLRSDSGEKKKRFKQELHFCSNASHPNILRVVASGVAPLAFSEAPFYVMKRYPETLRGLMKKGMAAGDAVPFFLKILEGVAFAHGASIIHRDLKPENILCDPVANEVVIADFGIAHFQEEDLVTLIETRADSRMANFAYRAPEQLQGKGPVGPQADVFALGLMLNEMFTRNIPSGTNFPKVSSVDPGFDYLDSVVEKAMYHSPTQRFQSAAEMMQDILVRAKLKKIEQGIASTTAQPIPAPLVNDELIQNPIRVIAADFSGSTLTLVLSGTTNPEWQSCFRSVGGNGITWFVADQWDVRGDQARNNRCDERTAQQAIDQFKGYLQPANNLYRQKVEAAAIKRAQDAEKKRIAEIQEEEKRLRVLKTIRI